MNKSHTFSKNDADRILKRAAEIEGSDDTGPVSVEELRSIASEAGFGAQAVERAIAEAQQAAVAQIQRNPVQKSGVVLVYLSTFRSIPIEINSDQLMRAVRLLAPYREGPPQVNLEEQQFTWRDRKGIRFSVTSVGGTTEIHVTMSKFAVRRRRLMRWVKDAADRLESLVLLVAAQEPSTEHVNRLPPGA